MSTANIRPEPHGGARWAPLVCLLGLIIVLVLFAAFAEWSLDKEAIAHHPWMSWPYLHAVFDAVIGWHPHPLHLLARLIDGKDEPTPCQDFGLLWSAIVFAGGLMIALLIWFEASELHGLRAIFEAPWSGLGQDVETAGMVEAVLRLALVVAALLLCLGVIGIAAEAEDEGVKSCYRPAADADPPPVAVTPLSLAEIERNLAVLPAIADTLRAFAAKPSPTDLVPALRAMDQHLAAIESAVRTPTNSGSGPSAPPPDVVNELNAIDRQLAAIEAAVRTPREPVKVEVANTGPAAACSACCPAPVPPPPHRPAPPRGLPGQPKDCTAPALRPPVQR